MTETCQMTSQRAIAALYTDLGLIDFRDRSHICSVEGPGSRRTRLDSFCGGDFKQPLR